MVNSAVLWLINYQARDTLDFLHNRQQQQQGILPLPQDSSSGAFTETEPYLTSPLHLGMELSQEGGGGGHSNSSYSSPEGVALTAHVLVTLEQTMPMLKVGRKRMRFHKLE